MLISILAIFFAGLIAGLFYKQYTRATIGLVSAILAGVITYFTNALPAILKGKAFSINTNWISSLDIHLSFYLDGLSLLFALLVTVFGLLIFWYSVKYMEGNPQANRFMGYLLFFMASMLGLVLSNNLLGLFIFWELTSFSSYLLIGFNHKKLKSRRAARQALLITAGGGLALLSGFILLEIGTSGGFDYNEILTQSDSFQNTAFSSVAIVLISLGAFTKSAQFPFHFWLPNAMEAPTPVSAYLHSATMVKAGVYLLLRMHPLFSDAIIWQYLLGFTGALTMIYGAVRAFGEDDLKKILAYTTISALGIFFMMIGVGSNAAINAAIIYIVAHALYKGTLFLAAGIVDHSTGTRKISELSGLVRKMPLTTIAVILACASMAGVIPFIGFVGKESLYHSLYHGSGDMGYFYLIVLFLAGAFFTAITIKIVYQAFIKKGDLPKKSIHEGHLVLVAPALILASLGLIVGMFPGTLAEPLLQWAGSAVHTDTPDMHLKLWHGFNTVLLLSLLTLLCGAGLYFGHRFFAKSAKPKWLSGDYLYGKALDILQSCADISTRILQNGLLRNYIATILFSFSIILSYVLIRGNLLEVPSIQNLVAGVEVYEVVIIALITFATVFLFKTRSRLVVTATFGIIGYSIALSYTLFSAPDVAITQFLAETLTLILLIIILHRLPSYTIKKPIARLKYLPVALLFGTIMSVTSYIMLSQPKDSALKKYFLENSISEGKGHNAVNVILVDFRALDTLGEITVLTITMVGIIALLNTKNKEAGI